MFAIAPANRATLPACLALLPATADPRAEHWAACSDGEVVGAAALSWVGMHDPPGFGATLFVREAWRRRGVGRALIDAIAAAATGETIGLWSAERYRDDAPAAAFLARCGFGVGQRDVHFRMLIGSFFVHMEAIVTRLQRAGRVPEAMTTPTLRDAPLDRTAMLVAASFGQSPAMVAARLRLALADPAAARLNPDVSTVVLEGDTVVGALLVETLGDIAQIDCNVVTPRRRRSCVNALQLFEATRRAAPLVTWIGFHCDDKLTDTMNLAARGGGEVQYSEARYWRALPVQATSAA